MDSMGNSNSTALSLMILAAAPGCSPASDTLADGDTGSSGPCTGQLTARSGVVLEANHKAFFPVPGAKNLAFTSTGRTIQSAYNATPPALDCVLISFDLETGATLTTTDFGNLSVGPPDISAKPDGWFLSWQDLWYEQSGTHVTTLSSTGVITADKLVSPVVYGSNNLPDPSINEGPARFAWSDASRRFGAAYGTCKFATYGEDAVQKSNPVQLSGSCGQTQPRVLAYGDGYAYARGGYNGAVAQITRLTGTGQQAGGWIPLLSTGYVLLMYVEPGPLGRACTVLQAADNSLSISCLDSSGIISPSNITFPTDGNERLVVWNGTSLGVLTIPADTAQEIVLAEVSPDGTWSTDDVRLPNAASIRKFSWSGREYLLFQRPNDDFSDRTMTSISRCR